MTEEKPQQTKSSHCMIFVSCFVKSSSQQNEGYTAVSDLIVFKAFYEPSSMLIHQTERWTKLFLRIIEGANLKVLS
jgi:hypothetical protein